MLIRLYGTDICIISLVTSVTFLLSQLSLLRLLQLFPISGPQQRKRWTRNNNGFSTEGCHFMRMPFRFLEFALPFSSSSQIIISNIITLTAIPTKNSRATTWCQRSGTDRKEAFCYGCSGMHCWVSSSFIPIDSGKDP